MFVNAALARTDREHDPAPRDPERGRLLGLVRKLIAYGRALAASVQGASTAAPPPAIAHRFASLSLAVIIARITRGLMIAAALEQRLLHPRPKALGQAERKGPIGTGAARKPRQAQPDERDELLGALPSAREIAARMRNRKTGDVIVEICRDLGIDGHHPLWRDVLDAITFHGGNRGKILRVIWQRAAEAIELGLVPEPDPRFDHLVAALTHPS